MKILATAHPNPRYRHYNNVKRIVLQARLVNSKVYFYEVDTENNKTKCRDKDFIKQLINGKGESINSRPFLHNTKPNVKFYAVLMRHRKQYKEHFEELKGKDFQFERTKFKKS